MSAVADFHKFCVEYMFIPEEGSEEKPIIRIYCPCEEVDELIENLDWIPSVPSRHFLYHDIWPFTQSKNSKEKDSE